jgi:tetratricopeptide (TPR) repeat protein
MAVAGLWAGVAHAWEEAAMRERRDAEAKGQRPWRHPAGGPGVAGVKDVWARRETHLRAALALLPADFEAHQQLGEVLAAAGRRAEAVQELLAARRVAPTASDEARIWFRIAGERTRLGAYDLALDAYARQLALGDVDPQALTNSAELEMALGRLEDAIVRYREAVAIEERDSDRRSHVQGLALGYFGLAVALDRDNRPAAAREAVGRALALDSGLAVLHLAEERGGDLFFVPPGDVAYYVGVAREAQGRADDAAAAFRDYLRVADPRYAGRARDHLARLASGGAGGKGSVPPAAAPPDAGRLRLRVVHEATVVADGPLVAPLIDAAWRLDPRLLDACLSDVAGNPAGAGTAGAGTPREFKLTLDVDIDAGGRVSRASVQPSLDPPAGSAAMEQTSTVAPSRVALGSCIENAVRERFRVSRPARKRSTRARIELVLAPVASMGQ